MKRRATLRDIANALNISITTVSRALNDKDDISSDTKKAVLEVAKMLDYKPNAIAVSLRKNVANNIIGVILPNVDHYFFSTILKGIITSSHLSDYMVMIGDSAQDFTKEQNLIEQFADYFVSGVIYAPARHPDSPKNIALLRNLEIPFVLIDRKFDDFYGSFVQHDDFSGAYTAVTHLISQGCKTIAHIKGDESCSISTERLKGYLAALNNHGLPTDNQLIKSCLHANKEDGYKLTKQLFSGHHQKPDAIFAVTDHVASGIYEYANEHKIKIPEDLSVVGYSNSDLADHLTPKLTTVDQNGNEMGTIAFNFLKEQIKNKNSIYQKTFSSRLIVRSST